MRFSCGNGIRLVGLIACAVGSGAVAQMPQVKVVTHRAEMRSVPRTAEFVATVLPVRRSTIGAETAGAVVEMPVRQGDRVHQGDLICRLTNVEAEARLAEAEARLGVLEAGLLELTNGTRPEDLARSEAFYEEAKSTYDRWSFEKARVDQLMKQSYAEEKEYTETISNYEGALRRMAAAKAMYERDLAGPRSEVIEQKRREVAEQEAVVDRMKEELRKTRVVAPFDGLVVMRHAELGQWLSMGGAVVDLVDLSSVLVRVDVQESAIAFVEEGQPARVFVEALQESFEGKVKHIIPLAEEDARTFPVEVEVPNPDGRLKAGMFARATLISGPEAMTVAVPKDAVVEFSGSPHVALVMPNPNPREGGFAAVRMPVTTGADIDDWIAITSPNVHPGMEFVVRGTERILPFPTPVTLVDAYGRPVEREAGAGGPGHGPPGQVSPGQVSPSQGSPGQGSPGQGPSGHGPPGGETHSEASRGDGHEGESGGESAPGAEGANGHRTDGRD